MSDFLSIIREFGYSLLSVIYPRLCEVCGETLVDGEKVICTHCQLNMPRLFPVNDGSLNSVEKKCFVSECCVAGTALFRYHRHDDYSKLIHKFKYNGRKEIARDLGAQLALERKESSFFDSIDYLVPVPIHYIKKFRRGYNQSHEICKGIRRVTGIDISTNLYAKKHHSTQTRKSAEERWSNTENLFAVRNPEILVNKHIAIVDDVVTTGATMQHCAAVLKEAVPGIRISFVAIATTEQ